MAQIDPFLYIVLENSTYDPVYETYDATIKSVSDIVSRIFIITRKGSGSGLTRIEWDAQEISLDDVQFNLTYDSGISSVSNIPKNVGRYDYTVTMTYVRNIPGDDYNGTYRNFFTTNYFVPVPPSIPTPDEDVYSDPLFDNETGFPTPQRLRNTYKFLVIEPCPVSIIFTEDELGYTGNTLSPEYTTNPQLLDPTNPNAPGNVPMRLEYSGNSVIAPLAAPVEVGTYTVSATSIDFNYVGNASTTYTIRNLTNIEAEAAATEYQEKVDEFNVATSDTGNGNILGSASGGISSSSSLINSSYASSSNRMTKDEFVKTGILTILEKADIQALGTIKTLAECAQSLPQRLMVFAAAKIAQLILSYVPGLGIIKLLTSIMELIKTVQKIMELIEFVKENPWAFLNQVLETSGAYEALGNLANEQFTALQQNFPGMSGDVGQFVKDVANGVVDVCNLDMNNLIKADNTKTPSGVLAFIPATSRQPREAKGKYDLFQFKLRDALYKDNDKIDKLLSEGDDVGVQEYVSMLTAVHELAYNYHDRIASSGTPVGLLSGSSSDALSSTYSALSDVTNILSGVYPDSTSTSTTVSGTKGFSINSLNAGLTAVANTVSGVTSGLNAANSFVLGETGFSFTAFKNEFNYSANETLKKNPLWSNATIKEYNDRVNLIKSTMENNIDAIRNNPANASAAEAGSLSSATTSSPISGFSSVLTGVNSVTKRALDGSWISS